MAARLIGELQGWGMGALQVLSPVGVEGVAGARQNWYSASAGVVQNTLDCFSMNKLIPGAHYRGPVKGQAGWLRG